VTGGPWPCPHVLQASRHDVSLARAGRCSGDLCPVRVAPYGDSCASVGNQGLFGMGGDAIDTVLAGSGEVRRLGIGKTGTGRADMGGV
jgi:hypothetical protein